MDWFLYGRALCHERLSHGSKVLFLMTNRILEIVIRPCHLLKPNTRTSLTPKKNHLVHCNKFFESLQATFMRILRELTLFTNIFP